jgi:Pentapeptide repeats (8 copies)/Ion channel
MTESNSQPEKLQAPPRFSQEQYDMLKRCSDKKDVTEWNEWRKRHPNEDIWLQAVNFKGRWLRKANFIGETVWRQAEGEEIDFTAKVHLEGTRFEDACLEQAVFAKAHIERSCFWGANAKNADFHFAHLEEAKLGVANFEGCDFSDAILKNAYLTPSELSGAKFTKADLRGCSIRACVVNGSTRFWECIVNCYSKEGRYTDCEGTPLNSLIIDPPTKQLLEYNVRRMNWEDWYPKQHRSLAWLIRKFWEISDYGISTGQIIKTFFAWAVIFAGSYLAWGLVDYHLLGIKDDPGIVSNLFTLEHGQKAVSPGLVPFRAVYFSIVTMTTLGFGDMYASTQGLWRGLFGHILLAIQVILGYVLLGALVTRFAVLFTAGGPAGKFADDNDEKATKGAKNSESR